MPRAPRLVLLWLFGACVVPVAATLGADPRVSSPLDALLQSQIPPEELTAVGEESLPKQLVAVIGQSRLAHWGRILRVIVSPDGTRLATSGDDGTARIWDASTGRELQRFSDLDMINGIAFSPDGKLLASAAFIVLSPTAASQIILWDIQTGRPVRKMGGSNFGTSVAFSADGKRVAAAGSGMAYIWDAATGEQLLEIAAYTEGNDSSFRIIETAFSPDGQTLITSARAPGAPGKRFTNVVKFWNVSSGELAGSIEGATGPSPFLRDGTLILTAADGAVVQWDPRNDREVRRFSGPRENVEAPTISPDEALITITINERLTRPHRQSLEVWDLKGGKRLREIETQPYHVLSVVLTPDGKRLIAGGVDGRIRFWDTYTGESQTVTGEFDRIVTVAFSPDETTLALGKRDGSLAFWDVASQESGAAIHAHPEWLRAVAYSPDGKRLATGGEDREIHIWDIVTMRNPQTVEVPERPVFSLRFSPDGSLLAAGAGGGRAVLFDIKAGKAVATVDCGVGLVRSVAFDRTGKHLAAACGTKITLRDISSGRNRVIQVPEMLNCVDLSSTGNLMAAGMDASDRGGQIAQVLVWNVENLGQPVVLDAHRRSQLNSQLNSLVFSPTDLRIASSGKDGAVRFWDPLQTVLIDTIVVGPPRGNVYKVVYSPSGRYLTTINGNGTVYILRL